MSEIKLQYRSTGNISPYGLKRMYFTCHPDDFEECFERVCQDVLGIVDREHSEKIHFAVYYTEDMTTPFTQEDRSELLTNVNVMIVPVTKKLLTSPNRARDEDIPFAVQNSIKVIPIIMEPELLSYYRDNPYLSKLQYVNTVGADTTEVDYIKKLTAYLEMSSHNAESIRRMREAFSAHIFLSYRKKDRTYANQLMKSLHNDEDLWGAAFWYDEQLTPGEVYTDEIMEALQNSDLYLLLVTPRLLEEGNYVMEKEYPEARRLGKTILPIMMAETSLDALQQSFEDLPEVISFDDEIACQEYVKAALYESPLHPVRDSEELYQLGKAYWNGIDTEISMEIGFLLLTRAALQLHIKACEKVISIFDDKSYPEIEKYYEESQVTMAKLALINIKEMRYEEIKAVSGEDNPETIEALFDFAFEQARYGISEGYNLVWKVYQLSCRVNGRQSRKTLRYLKALNMLLFVGSNHEEKIAPLLSVNLFEKRDELIREQMEVTFALNDAEDEDSLVMYNNFIVTSQMPQYEKIEHCEKLCALAEKSYGNGIGKSRYLCLLAREYIEAHNIQKAYEAYIKMEDADPYHYCCTGLLPHEWEWLTSRLNGMQLFEVYYRESLRELAAIEKEQPKEVLMTARYCQNMTEMYKAWKYNISSHEENIVCAQKFEHCVNASAALTETRFEKLSAWFYALSTMLYEAENNEKALTAINEAIARRKAEDNEAFPEKMYMFKSKVATAMGDYPSAISAYLEILKAIEVCGNEQSVNYLKTKFLLAFRYCDNDEKDKAIELYEELRSVMAASSFSEDDRIWLLDDMEFLCNKIGEEEVRRSVMQELIQLLQPYFNKNNVPDRASHLANRYLFGKNLVSDFEEISREYEAKLKLYLYCLRECSMEKELQQARLRLLDFYGAQWREVEEKKLRQELVKEGLLEE